MTAPALADCYAPVPLAWRHVRPGDVIVGKDGDLWTVALALVGDDRRVRVLKGHVQYDGQVDPDDVVTVLAPTTERDAATLLRDELGARLIDRRTA